MLSNKITEQLNDASSEIDEKSVLEILEIINNQDMIVPKSVKKVLPQIKLFIEQLILRFKKGGRLFYIGSGTSGRLGVLDASECPPTFSTDPSKVQGIIAGGYDALLHSIEDAEDLYDDGINVINKYNISNIDTVLGISASGSATFVLSALKESKNNGALTGMIACNQIDKFNYIDYLMPVIVGPEVIAGSTRMKAGTATKLILNMVSTTLMIKMNKTYGNIMVDLNISNNKLKDRGVRIISYLTGLDYKDSLDLLVLAKGDVKLAIVMNKKNCIHSDGIKILDKSDGNLKNALKFK